jgi:hypothetical protein
VRRAIHIGVASNSGNFSQFKAGLISESFSSFSTSFAEKCMVSSPVAMLKIGHISVDEIPTCPGKVRLSASLLCSNTHRISAYRSFDKPAAVLVGTRAATNISRG